MFFDDLKLGLRCCGDEDGGLVVFQSECPVRETWFDIWNLDGGLGVIHAVSGEVGKEVKSTLLTIL